MTDLNHGVSRHCIVTAVTGMQRFPLYTAYLCVDALLMCSGTASLVPTCIHVEQK